jgi:hypothetical protein
MRVVTCIKRTVIMLVLHPLHLRGKAVAGEDDDGDDLQRTMEVNVMVLHPLHLRGKAVAGERSLI